jgi:hypothetical protein
MEVAPPRAESPDFRGGIRESTAAEIQKTTVRPKK